MYYIVVYVRITMALIYILFEETVYDIKFKLCNMDQ
jgi:hypothetical protein